MYLKILNATNSAIVGFEELIQSMSSDSGYLATGFVNKSNDLTTICLPSALVRQNDTTIGLFIAEKETGKDFVNKGIDLTDSNTSIFQDDFSPLIF